MPHRPRTWTSAPLGRSANHTCERHLADSFLFECARAYYADERWAGDPGVEGGVVAEGDFLERVVRPLYRCVAQWRQSSSEFPLNYDDANEVTLTLPLTLPLTLIPTLILTLSLTRPSGASPPSRGCARTTTARCS